MRLLPRQYQQNQRFLKIRHLERSHRNYTGYMFGSSRIGTTWPAAVERHLPGERFYNMSVSSGTPLDAYLMLRHMVRSGYTVRHVYLQLDVDVLLTEHAFPQDDLFRRHHPRVTTAESLASFYWDFATVFPMQNLVGKLRQNSAPGINEYALDLEGTGRWFWPERDRRIESDWMAYWNAEESFRRPVTRGLRGTKLAQNLATLRDIRDLCARSGIRLTVFTNPDHQKSLDMYQIDALLEALRGVSQVTGFWDFTGYNEITMNDRNYYEIAHYRPEVGGMIASRIFKGNAAPAPESFGRYVDGGNVEGHLASLRASLERRP